jgi:hypothetical protein
LTTGFPISSSPHCGRCRVDLDKPQNDVAVAFAGGAQGGEAIGDASLKPDQPPD